MTTPRTPAFLIATLVFGLATSATPAIAQTGGSVLGRAGAAIQDIGGVVAALTTQVVRAEPYSADAITTVSQVLADGTRIDRTVRARVFRDGEGRTRREQTVLGLSSLSPSSDALRIVTITDPVAGIVSTLDEPTHTARQRRFESFGGVPRVAVPESSQADTQFARQQADRAKEAALDAQRLRALSETLTQLGIAQAPAASGGGESRTTSSLGTRQLEGIQVTGRRTTQTIPTGQIGNDRPIVVTDETWESPELHLLVSSRHSDPRTGKVEYRLVNIVRGEPSPDLFKVPVGYAVIGEAPRTDPNAPNARPAQAGAAVDQPELPKCMQATRPPDIQFTRSTITDALTALGKFCDVEVRFDNISNPAPLRSVRFSKTSVADAFRALVNGSGLTYTVLDERTVVVSGR